MRLRRGLIQFSIFGLIFCLFGFSLSITTSENYDMLIKGATIIDGTGKPAFKGDIAIRGEKIIAVGEIKGNALIEIDGSGLVACPGFIDPHSHADLDIFKYPLAENLVMQGITTFLGGNCGLSPAPKEGLTFGEWLSKVEKAGISVNYAPLVGHNTIRELVMGEDFKRQAKPDEIEEMKKWVKEAMCNGSFGISSSTDPGPGEYATIEEIIELAKVAQKYGGLYIPHTRHTQSQWPSDDPEEYGYGIYHGPIEDVWVGRYRGLLEAIEISRKAKIALHIAHLSTVYRIPQPHPDFLEEAAAKATLEIINKAREEGIDVTFDVIASSSSIASQTPLINEFIKSENVALEWLDQLTKEEFVEKLKTKEFRDRIKRIYETGRLKLGMIQTKADPYWMDCFKILNCKNSEYVGKTIEEIARNKKTEPLDTLFDILIEDPETKWVQFLDKRGTEIAISVFLKHPSAMPCTDISVYSLKSETEDISQPPPITYGLYPHYIRTYVKEKAVLSLEEAVMKATYLPSKRLGLVDRGLINPGAYADIVVFDFEKIRMKGDFLNPAESPEGIEYVLVNGKIVYKKMAHTGIKTGKVLRHEYLSIN